VEDSAHTTNNIGEFLRVALANGPVAVQDLQAKARAAGLLRQDRPGQRDLNSAVTNGPAGRALRPLRKLP
jgi:hypothetical protein